MLNDLLRTNLASFQKDFLSSIGITRVAFRIRAATTASVIQEKQVELGGVWI